MCNFIRNVFAEVRCRSEKTVVLSVCIIPSFLLGFCFIAAAEPAIIMQINSFRNPDLDLTNRQRIGQQGLRLRADMKRTKIFFLLLALMAAGFGCATAEPRVERTTARPARAEEVLDRTTLHTAPNWNVAQRLIKEGADVNAKDRFGLTPLHTAVRASRKDVVEVLIAHGADVDARSDHGQTPLFWAVTQKNRQMAEWLIAHGAEIGAKDSYGMTPLHGAAYAGRAELVDLLISKGADLNAQSETNMTPLHCAAAAGRQDVVQLLIAAGADIGIKDNEGRDALDWAQSSSHTEIAELLRKRGARE